ncbi:MAG: glycosyltransferase family 9 protein [Phycisphaerales bacterium]
MGCVEVFHLGALGDGVMVWSLLRAMARAGWDVEFVANGEHAALAAREIGTQLTEAGSGGGLGAGGKKVGVVRGVDIHRPEFERWWLGADEDAGPVREDVECVVTLCADEGTEAGRKWLTAAHRTRPKARVESVGAPGSASRIAAWKQWGVEKLGAVTPVRNPRGPVVLFMGAGSRGGEGDKRWPLEHWAALHAAIAGDRKLAPGGVDVIAGPVEAERWSEEEAELFEFMALDRERSGVLHRLDRLADVLRGARLVVSADTGPAHLAAQLGVPVLALFGPMDPTVWAPVGPQVCVLSPPKPKAMSWLKPVRAHEQVLEMLAQA